MSIANILSKLKSNHLFKILFVAIVFVSTFYITTASVAYFQSIFRGEISQGDENLDFNPKPTVHQTEIKETIVTDARAPYDIAKVYLDNNSIILKILSTPYTLITNVPDNVLAVRLGPDKNILHLQYKDALSTNYSCFELPYYYEDIGEAVSFDSLRTSFLRPCSYMNINYGGYVSAGYFVYLDTVTSTIYTEDTSTKQVTSTIITDPVISELLKGADSQFIYPEFYIDSKTLLFDTRFLMFTYDLESQSIVHKLASTNVGDVCNYDLEYETVSKTDVVNDIVCLNSMYSLGGFLKGIPNSPVSVLSFLYEGPISYSGIVDFSTNPATIFAFENAVYDDFFLPEDILKWTDSGVEVKDYKYVDIPVDLESKLNSLQRDYPNLHSFNSFKNDFSDKYEQYVSNLENELKNQGDYISVACPLAEIGDGYFSHEGCLGVTGFDTYVYSMDTKQIIKK